jgi:UrcA family protein
MKPLAHTLAHAFAALGLAGAAISPALANDAAPPSVTVHVADLDLTSPAGQRALDRRLDRAVRSVCADGGFRTGSRIMSREGQACLAKARASVRDQVAALTTAQQHGG